MKFIITLAFIICVNLAPQNAWPAFIFYLTLLATVFLLAQANWKTLLLRSLVCLPLILASVPLLFTGSSPYQQIRINPQSFITISLPGLQKCLAITIKSWLSILAAILLTSTTKFDDLLAALSQFGLPAIFISILTLMLRYLFLMVEEARCLNRARNSRSGSYKHGNKPIGSLFWRAKVTGKMVGNLLFRSLERSERVYAAMSSRGYQGQPLQKNTQPIPQSDTWIFVGGFCICGIILFIAVLFH